MTFTYDDFENWFRRDFLPWNSGLKRHLQSQAEDLVEAREMKVADAKQLIVWRWWKALGNDFVKCEEPKRWLSAAAKSIAMGDGFGTTNDARDRALYLLSKTARELEYAGRMRLRQREDEERASKAREEVAAYQDSQGGLPLGAIFRAIATRRDTGDTRPIDELREEVMAELWPGREF